MLLLLSLQWCVCQSSFPLPAAPSSVAVNRENGEVFVAAGSQLLRLSDSLVRIENVTVGGELVRIALSPDGSRLVGCLRDNRTCLVYNSSDLNSGTRARVDSALYRAENGLAIVAVEEGFYLGSEGSSFRRITNYGIHFAQYNYSGDIVRGLRTTSEDNPFTVDTTDFVRHFYGGFTRNGYVYYFVADENPSANAVRVLRMCDCSREACTSQFEALYEQVLTCGGSTTADTRVCGVDLLESFADQTGPLVVVTQCNVRNRACAFRLSDIDGDMDAFYSECRPGGMYSGFRLPWAPQSSCTELSVSSFICCLYNILIIFFVSSKILPVTLVLYLPLMWKKPVMKRQHVLDSTWSILETLS